MSNTLAAILKERKTLNDVGITFIETSKKEEFLSYQELYRLALKELFFLQSNGMQPKDELIFQIDDNKKFITIFWACILGGIIPVPLSIGQNDDHKQKLFNVWPVLNNPYLIISKNNFQKLFEFVKVQGLEKIFSEIQHKVIEEGKINSSQHEGQVYEVQENEIAFIQFSSGSTGTPRGIMLTHKNLIVNMEAISEASNYSERDSMISWMPLTHDMGMIGFHLNPLFCGMNQYLLPTNLFIRRPAIWLDKASEHRVSILCSPNFGYKYVLKHCIENRYDLDLSHIRLIYNGAEPISEEICNDFLKELSKYGLKRHAMCPVYGLAEASLAVSISALDDEVLSIKVARNKLKVGDKVSLRVEDEGSISFINVGKSIKHCSIRISNEDNAVVTDGVVGYVQIKGDNVSPGYYNNQEATTASITKDGWLHTGDLGFMRDGALYITGRAKDIIFVNGQNYYAHDIERVAEAVAGIELNKIAVVGFFNNENKKEEIIAFVFHRGEPEKFLPIASALRIIINSKVGLEIDKIIPVKDIPRTTSGKLQRFKLLEQYEKGDFENVLLKSDKEIDELEGSLMSKGKPESELEHALLKIWENILKKDNIEVTQNFFEIGGNSLKAAEMEMLLLKEFQLELSFETLLKNQTIRKLAIEIKTPSEKKYTSIPAADKNECLVSSAQRRLYYAWELDKSSTVYNIPIAFQVKGKVDISRLETCIKNLILRHDSLRMSFHGSLEPEFKIHNATNFTSLSCLECNQGEVNEKLKSLVQPFDLANGPLFRIMLIKINVDRYVLFLDFHHIISDGISIYNFIDELLNLYRGRQLQALPIQFKDYACWEKQNLQSEETKVQEVYWLNKLQNGLPILEMPLDSKRPAIFSSEGEKIEFELTKQVTDKLKNLAKANECTLHVLIFTLYNILLSKYTGQEDIIIGIPVTGRRHPDLQNIQGMFVNNLAIRNIIRWGDSFTQLLQATKDNIINAFNNQNFPFENLIQLVGGKRDISRNPIFDTMFLYQNMGFPKMENDDFILSKHFFDVGFSKFDISMEVFDDEDSIKYSIEYATRLFKRTSIERFAKHFENLIIEVINKPNSNLLELTIITDHEYNEFIWKFNATKRNYPIDKTIHQLFEEQVKRTPDNIAVEYEDTQLTYKQLNDEADGFADLLRNRGIIADSITGILLKRSPKLVVSILAVLKAGGAYLPIDNDLPTQRINYLIANSQAKILITEDESISNFGLLDSSTVETINIDELALSRFSPSLIRNASNPCNLAYIIYTSGTTGEPKGVMIEHQSLVNYISWAADNYVRGEKASFPLFTSISFDLTITSIFTPLITGNSIIIYNDDGNEVLIEKLINANKAEVIKLTPSHLKIIAESKLLKASSENRLRRFIVGGEKLETYLAKEICDRFRNVEIYNEYGPTEATVGCMIHKFAVDEGIPSVPIGIPANNTQVYVLDKFLKPVPVGVSGEIYVSGDGIARGYIYNEVLTNQKFIPNPFLKRQRMYKTGDIARILPCGVIEYIGRSDQQVKINGYRIELSEIEHHLVTHYRITEALVIVKMNSKSQKILCAYYKTNNPEDGILEESALRNYLASRLPYYMIPACFVPIDQIPLTNNGKVDYKALPELHICQDAKRSLPSQNHIEEVSLKIWEEVLGESNLGVRDNFFELGGDSIKAVQIASRLFEKAIFVKVKDILTFHTIEQISLHAQTTGKEKKYEQGIITGEKGLSPIDHWFFSQDLENPNYYNQSILLKMHKEVDVKLLENAFEQLVKHHDGLRINYNPEKKVLFYNDSHLRGSFDIDEYEIGGGSSSDVVNLCEEVKKNFDITNSFLLKAAIIKDKKDSEMLFITAHHLIIDGVSWRILLEDLYTIYATLEKGEKVILPRKTATLIDWERKLIEYSETQELKAEDDYWQEVESTGFSIPQDFETNDWTFKNVSKLTGVLNKEKTTFLLKGAHQAYKTNVPILLNVALVLTLKEWAGLSNFVIEQESHGRHLEAIDVSRTVGWFTAIYPVKLELKDGAIGTQIKAIKEQIRMVPGQGLGYGIGYYLRNSSKNFKRKISEIRFNYLGQFASELNNEMFSFCNMFTGFNIGSTNMLSTKIELNLMVVAGELNLEINYNRCAHKRSTISWFKNQYIINVEKVLEHIKNEGDMHFTPSDFDLDGVEQEELDQLFL